MKFSLLTLLLICTCSTSSFAQSDSSRTAGAFFTPTSLISPAYPTFHIGIEKRYASWGTVAELGVLFPKSVYHNSTSLIGLQDFASLNKGFFIKAEQKRYWNQNWYVAFNASLLYNNYKRTDTFDETPEITDGLTGFYFCSTCVEDSYSIKKTMINGSLKIGARFDFQNNFYLDGYLGLGVSYHSNKHSKNSELHMHPATADAPIAYYNAHYPGSYFLPLPIPVIGLRVGYNFTY